MFICRTNKDTIVEPISPDLSLIQAQWEDEQETLKAQLITETQWQTLRYIGGVDISFVKDSNTDACVCLVVLDAQDLSHIVYQTCRQVQMTQPYIPGFLAFRECDHILCLLDELQITQPNFMPQVILVDGNGTLHPRGFGLACHLGVRSGIPTIGVAKNFLWCEDLDAYDRNVIRQKSHDELQHAGDSFLLQGKSGTIYGACLRATDESNNPIYISTGHKVSLQDAIALCHRCSLYRIPEPVRLADKISRAFLQS